MAVQPSRAAGPVVPVDPRARLGLRGMVPALARALWSLAPENGGAMTLNSDTPPRSARRRRQFDLPRSAAAAFSAPFASSDSFFRLPPSFLVTDTGPSSAVTSPSIRGNNVTAP